MMNKGGKMKSEKGVTILSLTIYLILLTVAIGFFSIVRTYFYDNIRLITADALYASEFNKVNGFIVQDVKRNYNVGVVSNRNNNTENPHAGTSEQKPVAAFRFGNENVYLYYGNTDKGTVFGTDSQGKSYNYLNQGLYKYTNKNYTGERRALKIAGGVTDFSVELTNHGMKKILKIGVEIADGRIFTNMENPMRYTLKYW